MTQMNDIVERLEATVCPDQCDAGLDCDCRNAKEARDEIVRLRAERDRLREALQALVDFTGAHGGPYEEARAALDHKPIPTK
jgi:hypothetical protein